ncbi:hypothetical protein [Thomasclavelia saccharogumia]|uniref:hypothetical protein n=1 Tax=Thomasclavelia saccharogumia TaxID=341225 RepID=UPI00047E1C2F|nr:hypothetical protein [Thomasclavelia saccharogumia]
MISLLVDSRSFNMIDNGSISHLIVCKEEGIQKGDLVSLYDNNKKANCLVKVNYVDCEGSGVDENYCILNVKKV